MPRQAGAVGEKIARNGVLAGHRIVHLKFRQVGPDGLVPVHLTFIVQHGESKRREGLGNRTNRKKRIGVHGELMLDVAESVTLGVNHLSILHDSDGQARHLPLLHGLRRQIIQALQLVRRVDLRGWGGRFFLSYGCGSAKQDDRESQQDFSGSHLRPQFLP